MPTFSLSVCTPPLLTQPTLPLSLQRPPPLSLSTQPQVGADTPNNNDHTRAPLKQQIGERSTKGHYR